MTALAILIDLVVPVTRIQLGSIVFDPLEQALGRPLSEVLSPVCVTPTTQRTTDTGPRDVYRLSIGAGEGVSIALGELGALGLANEGGLLVITVPNLAATLLLPRLQRILVQEERVPASQGVGEVKRLRCKVSRGDRLALPLGRFGELGVEVV